ncbi:MAG: 50S ribosomal protein L21e [Candidatus Helarchaeales archaeon]
MARKSHGYKSRHTRGVFKKKVRERGMSPLGRTVLQNYEIGDYVDIVIDPSVQKGQPHFRFHGRTGKVIEKRGRALVIEIKDGKKKKTVISRIDHVRKSKSVIQKSE